MPNVGTRVLARTAGLMSRTLTTGRMANGASKLAGKIMPKSIWNQGAALTLAAERAGHNNYIEMMTSRVRQTHSGTLEGEFVVSGYFAFAFHFAFVTGLLFPQFMEAAVANPAGFYAKEVSSSAGIAALEAFLMVAGHMGTMARKSFVTANIAEDVEGAWNEALQGNFAQRAKFYLSFLKIPLGKFPGVMREGLSYKVEGESPLEVSATGPGSWDRTVSRLAWLASIPLIGLAIVSGELPAYVEWITRIVVPLAVIATLGQHRTGAGALKTFLADKILKDHGLEKAVKTEENFDMTEVKQQLEKGEEI